jgi:6-phosphofructokinase 1
VSEGFDLSTGNTDEAIADVEAVRDAFGHVEYGAARATTAQVVINHLNAVGLPARGNAHGAVPGVLQRSTCVLASPVDREEAYAVGAHAVELAVAGRSGVMAALQRRGGGLAAARHPYEMVLGAVDLLQVANFHRALPPEWLSDDRLDVTDAFLAYARPLIGDRWVTAPVENGIARFARLQRVRVQQLLPRYVPQNHR